MSSLEERLLQGPLPPAEAARLVWHLCALAERDGEVLGEVPPVRVQLLDGGITLQGPLATQVPGYVAPERAQGHASPASDVYSLGCLLYACVTGRPPFERALPASAKHLESVLARCLTATPSGRYASVAELKQALTGLDQTLISGSRVAAAGPALKAATLGPWALETVLGEGTMGQVFRARHSMLGRLAAIKVLRADQYQNPELVQRFFQEARTVNQINHEHIVEISDFVQEPGPNGPSAVYCVMELLQGHTLGAAIRETSLSVARTAHIVRQVADALAAAHRVGVVHRDVKPDNIMLIERAGQRDYVKVLDFGVAKLTGADGKAMVATTEGAIIGTPICMSPEQARGDDVDARSDVWAVGVILYRLLSGQYPFDAPNFVNMAVQIITQPVPSLPAKTASGEPFPPAMAALIQRCLQKEREARLSSMEEVRQALDAISAGQMGPQQATPRKSKKWGLALVGAALALGLAAAAFLLRPSANSQQVAPDASVVAVAAEPVDSGSPFDVGAAASAALFDAGRDELDAGDERPQTAAVDAGASSVAKPVRLPSKLTPALLMPGIARLRPLVFNCLVTQSASLAVKQGTVRLTYVIEQSGVMSNLTLTGGGPTTEQCVRKRLGASALFPRHLDKPRQWATNFDFKLAE
jgi:eukaryotic-like serine/threonine-protein kinase